MCNYAPTAAARSDLDRVWVGLRRLKAQQDLAFLALTLLTAQPGYPLLHHPCLNQLQSYWWRLTGMLERRTYRKLHMHPPSDPMLHGPHENSRNEDILHALESNFVILGLSVCYKGEAYLTARHVAACAAASGKVLRWPHTDHTKQGSTTLLSMVGCP